MVWATLFLLAPLDGLQVVDSKEFPAELQRSAMQATVRIVTKPAGVEGSGAIIGASRPFIYILTACHVIQGADELELATFSATSYPRPANVYRSAKVIAQSREQDLALLQIATSDRPPATVRIDLASRPATEKSFVALSVGCTAGKLPSCDIETIQGKRSVRKRGQAASILHWEADRKTIVGRSGGPLIDQRGALIGVCSGSGNGKGYYVHGQEIRRFLDHHGMKWLYAEENGKTGR